ncbi:Piso0_002348 [Millerozyma farinosa CBS 7064]|uniref:Hsp70 nucleotide exchange factor FES1 n=1 Tax=Pichia sorbitophila (strain ATCC MYA-4447 / BCRC 22081 / CBS 7064 / NBRC 10061 / NRRL Y-12695) TaxID=559304 RepID=G8YET6_PICSO|nr:Piso0_002348 [Millerozyma farinosa CBS 7064]
MDKLLNWSIAQQSGDKEAIEKVGNPDPKMLEQLFGGPDEPTLMKQAFQVIENPEATVENKEIAFDNFEMLIENLDNANNIENLGLWPNLINQLEENIPESLRVLAASCVGVAVQNNPTSQENFVKHNGVSALVSIASDKKSPVELELKTLFALSSLLRNSPVAYAEFEKNDGWKIFESVDYEHEKIKLRSLSIISAILSTSFDKKVVEEIHNHAIIKTLINILSNDEHIGCIDKALNIISQLFHLSFEFSKDEIQKIGSALQRIESKKDQISTEDFHHVQKSVSAN